MRRWLTRHPKAAAAALLALFCSLLGAWLFQPSSVPGAVLVRASYDGYFRFFDLSDGPPTNSSVVIVYLDLESHLRLGQDPAKPWPRELHSRLLRRLKAAGARAVVFDIVFDTPGASAPVDRDLADAMRAHGSVVLAAELSMSSQSTGEGDWGRTTRLALPMESFLNAAATWGLGEVGVEDDFVARRHFAGREADGAMRSSLTWATGRLLGLSSVSTNNGPASARWFRYYGPPVTLPHVSFSQAIQPGAFEEAAFRDKIVFVGARPMAGLSQERRDEFRSPLHAWGDRDLFMPGVEVHATQMLNLLRGDWLTRPADHVIRRWLLLTGIVFGAGLLWLRPLPAGTAAVVGGGAVIGLAVIAFRQANVWFPWLIIVGAQIPVALGGSVLFHSIEWHRARRRFEAARRVAEARIREQAALIDKAHDAILVRDLDGRVTYANPSAERLFGWSLNELQEGGSATLFAGSAAAETRRLALEHGEWNGELSQPTRSGKALTLESRWTLLRDEDGRPKGLLIISSDATEKKQLEAETLRMQRMEAIGSLAGGMAHDLNNALAPILMGTQLLRRETHDDNARRILSLMESSTRRGADMVRQVLLFARGKQGDFERLDARALVQEVEKLARDTFPQNITVNTHVAGDLWPVRGNATQLHQLMLNLCVNARDAMPEGGSLSLAADNVDLDAEQARTIPEGRAGRFVVVMVSDTGSGIAPEILPRIFEPFFTTKPEGRGTGLGLSTTARILKAHDGFIAVQSLPGEGTTFEIYLPCFCEQAGEAAITTVSQPVRGRGQLILVADDDEAVLELLRRSLEEQGYRVLTAANGAEAVSQFRGRAGEVSLFISDHSMPVMDGARAIAAIREIRADLPVIILSGDGEAAGVGAGDSSPVEQLSKPVELEALLRAVSQALAGSG
jgi:PAS domain S-box-containing protein